MASAVRSLVWAGCQLLACSLPEAEGQQAPRSCRISAAERCPLSMMAQDEITMVYPGGGTRCIFSGSSDYAFEVLRGDEDKLLVYFQGGGFCWDQPSTFAVHPTPCRTTVAAQQRVGIFDRSEGANPFRQYTVLHVQDCSGDLHVGNAVRWYLDPLGTPVEQRGYLNARAALDWALANMATRLDALVLSGCSSGAVGVQLWAAEVLGSFRFARAAVVVDSYVGLFPGRGASQGYTLEGAVLKDLGACDSNLFTGDLGTACETEALTVPDVFEAAIRGFPAVAFASINSKADRAQIAAYQAIARENWLLGVSLDADSYYAQVNELLRRYNSNANYISYLVTSDRHCYTPYPILFSTTAAGLNSTEAPAIAGEQSARATPLAAWLQALPVAPGGSAASECHGELLARDAWHGHGYCDASQAGKVVTATNLATMPSSEFGANTSTSQDAMPQTVEEAGGSGPAPPSGPPSLSAPPIRIGDEPSSLRTTELLLAAARAQAEQRRANWAWYYWGLLTVMVGLCYAALIENGLPLPGSRLAGVYSCAPCGCAEASEEEDAEWEDEDGTSSNGNAHEGAEAARTASSCTEDSPLSSAWAVLRCRSLELSRGSGNE